MIKRAAGGNGSQPRQTKKIRTKSGGAERGMVVEKGQEGNSIAGGKSRPVDMTEAIKTLIQIAREQGHLTHDDINEVFADEVSPNDLDTLYTKLHSVGIEVVVDADVEKTKPEDSEAEEARPSEALDDPVRIAARDFIAIGQNQNWKGSAAFRKMQSGD